MSHRTFSLMIAACLFLYNACGERDRKGDLRFSAPTMKEISEDATYSKEDSSRANWPERFGFGKKASTADIIALDIDIGPDGKGLPEGTGRVKNGMLIYRQKCIACHGATGKEGPYDVLVSKGESDKKAIGNYWPYATTLFDYIRRAMPFDAPGSLNDQEVYHLTAYLLYENGIIDSMSVINARNLSKVEMPARSRFVLDDRKGGPEVR
ncbi:c-type cytochrome [Olivibacter sitiensis]|uniref:c-type cytochrome n=1 Tax=Olivibacter sitiensis TaxID=376470 RepID=UPI001FE23274|nr:cytochrome c [Olivibacter sitiensis]